MTPSRTTHVSCTRAVFSVKVEPNYAQPWQMCPQRSSTGSAFVLDPAERLILTNSHVVRAWLPAPAWHAPLVWSCVRPCRAPASIRGLLRMRVGMCACMAMAMAMGKYSMAV